jgi:hypothetical protein
MNVTKRKIEKKSTKSYKYRNQENNIYGYYKHYLL